MLDRISYNKGVKARRMGHPRLTNPFVASLNRNEWFAGWDNEDRSLRSGKEHVRESTRTTDRILPAEFDLMCGRAERIEMREPGINNATRRGSYFTLYTGLASATYFVGMGRDSAEFMWQFLIEYVG